jgi:hemolysin III
MVPDSMPTPEWPGDTADMPSRDDARLADLAHKPLLRGWFHAGITPLAVVAGIILIALADGAAAKWASAAYFASSLLLFGNSAIYHVFNWAPRVKAIFRRIDHANIFLLIAGTYTPVSVGLLSPRKATILLICVWSGALVGILFRVFWINSPRWLYVPLYILLGWAAVIFMGDMFRANAAAMVLLFVGGVLYTIGAVFYGLKWPLARNRYFGFHELFHSCTVAAFFCHWAAALLAVLPAG